LSLFLGKPSIKNVSLPLSFIAFLFGFEKIIHMINIFLEFRYLEFVTFSRSVHVISTGTIVPFRIWLSISSPIFDSGLFRSALRRSPADK